VLSGVWLFLGLLRRAELWSQKFVPIHREQSIMDNEEAEMGNAVHGNPGT
jgi:hypothetical protein